MKPPFYGGFAFLAMQDNARFSLVVFPQCASTVAAHADHGNGGEHLSSVIQEMLDLRLLAIECQDYLADLMWANQENGRGEQRG